MARWLLLTICALSNAVAANNLPPAADTQMIKSLTLEFLEDRSEGDRRKAFDAYDRTKFNDDFEAWAGMIGIALQAAAPPYQTTIADVHWETAASGDTLAHAFYRSISTAGGLLCGEITWRKQVDGSYRISEVSNVVPLSDDNVGKRTRYNARDPEFQTKYCPPASENKS